jgi:hypothetical protein
MASIKKISKYFVTFLQILVITTCFVLFVCQMNEIFEKFTKKMTTVGIRTYSQDKETKLLPCITACPWQAFKRHGFYYNRKTLVQETFEKDEIFDEITKCSDLFTSEYTIEEIHCLFFGRCYMVCPVSPSGRNSGLYFIFKNSLDLKGLPFFLLKGFHSQIHYTYQLFKKIYKTILIYNLFIFKYLI